MYIVIYTFYTYDEGHCSSWSRGMKNMYRFCWGNVSENDKLEGRKKKRNYR